MPLFINPSAHWKSQWSFITGHMALQPPMGLGFVAGYLRAKANAPVRIIDEIVHPLTDETLREELEKLERPRIVCLSSMTIQIARALELAALVKRFAPDATVVLGGIHPTEKPHEALAPGHVDVVIRHEGEETMLALYRCLLDGADYRDLLGISFRRPDGTFQDNARSSIVDLNDSPLFPYDLFEDDIGRYNSFGSISASRGCPFQCIFCSNRSITGLKFRYFPTEYIRETLDLLINKYNQKYIIFLDDVMFINKKRFAEITEMIIANGFHEKAQFHGGARADTITPEVAAQCRRANFVFFGVGVETGSDELLQVIKKKETREEIETAIRLITAEGMMTSGAFIYGIPGETREDRRKTLKYALELPIDNARFNVIVPYPGTELYDIAKRQGRLNVKENYYNFNVQYYLFGDEIPYVPPGVDKYELMFDTMWANLRFYLRWRTFTRFKKSALTGGGTIYIPASKRVRFMIDVVKFGVLFSLRFTKVGLLAALAGPRRMLGLTPPEPVPAAPAAGGDA